MTATTADITVDRQRILSTLNEDGSRRWIRPKLSIGRFFARRRAVAWILIALFTLAPYLRSGSGTPLFLLDLATRHFTLFGRTFLPTDTLLLAIFMVGVFVTIFFLTAMFGRVWCGWACPQTVYMEFVYRPIERLFDGAPGRAKSALARSPFAKPLKLVAYLLVSMFLAHTFLAWFVGVDRLLTWVRGSPFDHPIGFLMMAGVTGAMLFDFGYFREQTCVVACPYGRFQSALLDRESLIVSYDRERGEPRKGRGRSLDRGPAPRAGPSTGAGTTVLDAPPLVSQERTTGDCVDCGLCVATCPTGIDIREGLQMECVNCTQCIDACDAVMTKLKRPRGLIRYSSQNAMAHEQRHIVRPRVVIYSIILLVIAGAFGYVLTHQAPADVTVLRGLGRPFTELATGEVANTVRIKIVNRTDAAHNYLVVADEPSLRVVCETDPIRIEAGKSATIAASVIAPATAFTLGSHDARLRFSDDAGFARELHYRLMGPGTSRAARESAEDRHPKHSGPDADHHEDHR